MESALIEYFRFDEQDEGLLMGGKKYILAHQDLKVHEVTTPVNQRELLRGLAKYLRYGLEDQFKEEKLAFIHDLSEKIQSMFIDIDHFEYSDCQLDLVLNASELGLIPFELMLDKDKKPYFANKDKKLVLTRRQRLSSFENNFEWPFSPRLLFVYANGGGAEVPAKDHLYELKTAFAKWGNVDDPNFFRVLENPSFKEFSDAIKERDIEGKSFTHIHILAHGGKIEGDFFDFEYGIVFGKDGTSPTPTQSIKELWSTVRNKPFLVNYMICDGANFSNPMTADKNPVQVTHLAGIPLVLGSQFPLSMEGSKMITKRLYAALLRGIDIREILWEIRIALFELGDNIHDWVSLVSYIRLPEGYHDILYKASLRLLMAELKYIRTETEKYLNNHNIDEDAFLTNRSKLLNCIALFEAKMTQIKGNKKYEQEALENLGLLGSAYKRLAELYFIKMKIFGFSNENEIAEQRKYLSKALDYYKQACDKNLSHHWSLVQYLSLDIVLNGKTTSVDYFYAAKRSIYIALENNPDSWCYGSLLEWYLMHKNSTPNIREDVFIALTELINKAKLEKDPYPLESTYNQITRYLTWWTPANNFNIGKDLVLSDLVLIPEILEKLELGKKEVEGIFTSEI